MAIHVTPIPRTIDPALLVPAGTITMWSGLIAAIPSGWFLCNGSNGTPDLRERFIQGAANGVEAGATGGSNTAAPGNHSNHTVTQPSGHTVTQPSAHSALGTHQHELPFGRVGSYNYIHVTDTSPFGSGSTISLTRADSGISTGGATQSVTAELAQAISGGTPDAHSGTAVSAHSGTDVNAHSAHSTADSRPTFFVLLYIMKS